MVVSGNLVADPELKFTPKGTAIASMRIASNHQWRRKDAAPGSDPEKDTLFITTKLFGRLAETVTQYKKKGDPLLVRGRLQLNEWTGNDGARRRTYELLADSVTFLGRGGGAGRTDGGDADRVPVGAIAAGAGSAASPGEVSLADDDDIGF